MQRMCCLYANVCWHWLTCVSKIFCYVILLWSYGLVAKSSASSCRKPGFAIVTCLTYGVVGFTNRSSLVGWRLCLMTHHKSYLLKWKFSLGLLREQIGLLSRDLWDSRIAQLHQLASLWGRRVSTHTEPTDHTLLPFSSHTTPVFIQHPIRMKRNSDTHHFGVNKSTLTHYFVAFVY